MSYFWNWGLGEASKLSLAVSNQLQEVGKEYTYRLVGGTPGARIAWTSFKDNEFTQEYQADYGQVVEANGTAVLKTTPRAEDVGVWSKQVELFAPDGSMVGTAQVQFRVIEAQPAPVAAPQGIPPSYESNWWEEPLFSLGSFEVTPVVAGIGIALVMAFNSGGSGRR